jgi:hypothetical protein
MGIVGWQEPIVLQFANGLLERWTPSLPTKLLIGACVRFAMIITAALITGIIGAVIDATYVKSWYDYAALALPCCRAG